MESQELRPKGLLFHYTSTEGLIGILRSGHIFATHIRYLNDSQEMFDALDHTEGFISEFDEVSRPGMKAFLKSAVTSFGRAVGAYVVSFTDDADALAGTEQIPGDRLNQWRAYSTPGKGFSLGFDSRLIDPSGLGKCIEGIDGLAYLHNCEYRRNMKLSILQRAGGLVSEDWRKALIEQALWLFKESQELGEGGAATSEEALMNWMRSHLKSEGYPQEIESRMFRARMNAALGMVINATALKNEAFFEEKEWRIIMLGFPPVSADENTNASRKVKFRNGTVGLTPYLEYPLNLRSKQSPLRTIVVGPTPHMDEAVGATKLLLQECGIRQRTDDYSEGVEVIPSQIPFRYW